MAKIKISLAKSPTQSLTDDQREGDNKANDEPKDKFEGQKMPKSNSAFTDNSNSVGLEPELGPRKLAKTIQWADEVVEKAQVESDTELKDEDSILGSTLSFDEGTGEKFDVGNINIAVNPIDEK